MANVTHIYGNEVTDAAARGSLAPAYSASSTYAVGDLVLHEGQLYECSTAISTAEEWTTAHWTAKTVADEVSSLMDGLDDKLDAPSTAGTSGQVLTSDGQGGQYWHTPSGGGGGSVTIDPTLTIEGDAADAKAAGDRIAEKAPSIFETASGDVASFDNGVAAPVKGVTITFSPIQSGEGTPSPTNVRPISGWNSIGVIVSPTDDDEDGTLYTISLGEARYAGYVNAVTGEMVLTSKMIVFDGSDDETWSYHHLSYGELFRTSVSDRVSGLIDTFATAYFCNRFTQSIDQGSGRTNGKFAGSSTNVDFVYDSCTSLDAWKTYLASNNIQLVYPLATPLTVQLTGIQIRTLQGQNYVWSEAGSIVVQYSTDTQEYIDTRIDAINDQISDLTEDIEDAYAHKYVLSVDGWSDTTFYTNGFIRTDGTVSIYGSNAFRYTDFIPVKENDRINYNLYGNGSSLAIVTFYNSNKVKTSNIIGASSWKEGSALVPAGSSYVRFSSQNSNPQGTFSVEEWTRQTGDETVSVVETYSDSLVTLTQENVVLTLGDIPLIYGYIWNNTGKYYFPTDGYMTDYIPVSEGDTVDYRLFIYGESKSQYALTAFDETKTEVSHVTSASNEIVNGTYTVPEGVSYVILSWHRDWFDHNGWFKITLATLTQRLLDFCAALSNRPTSILKGKQWCCLGDSITSGSSTVRCYMNWIQDRTCITPWNYGLSSTAIAKDSATVDHNMATRYASMYDGADYITVFGGTNDHGRSLPIGQWGDADQMTVYGAMKILCEGLINKYIGKKIGFILPLPKCTTDNNVTTDYSYPSASFYPYIQCIEDVCARYSIPVLDMYKHSDMHPSISAFRTACMPDGLHPNSDGQELMSYRIQSFLESL